MKTNLFEIYFDKEFIFPYGYLELFKGAFEYYNDSNIYMVLLRNKLQIMDAEFKNDRLSVTYIDLSKNKSSTLTVQIFKISVPDKFILIDIIHCGMAITVQLTTEGFDFIKNKNGGENISRQTSISIYDFVTLGQKNIKTDEEYEVLYIGETGTENQSKTIFDRLEKHEKVIKIYRDYNIKYRDKELVVFVLRSKYRLNTFYEEGMCLSNSKWENFNDLDIVLTETDLRKITEALLINHFKPEYNKKFKNSILSGSQKTFSKLINAGIDMVSIGLNLFLQDNNDLINLTTKNTKTSSKMRILFLDLKSLVENKDTKKEFITFDDISDDEYRLIQ